VLNRGNARKAVSHKDGDSAAFVKSLKQAQERTPIRLLSYCPMPNHFHLAVWPRRDDDLSDFMTRLMTARVRRYHQHDHSSGRGHIRQGRSKAFPIQEDEHLLTVLRYIERNPLHANLAKRAGDWPWSSACPRGGDEPVPNWDLCGAVRSGSIVSMHHEPRRKSSTCAVVFSAAGRSAPPRFSFAVFPFARRCAESAATAAIRL
jgi:REP element-mobilizing transposase RayT